MHSSDMSEKTTSQFIVYALHHPESSRVYIGKSTQGMKRPREHSTPSAMRRDARLPKTKWIKSLRKKGLTPEIVVLEECASAHALNEAEKFHIEYMKAIGGVLLNCSIGGDGLGCKHTDETRAQMSATRKKMARENDNERTRLAAMLATRWAVPGAHEKASEAAIRRQSDPVSREKNSSEMRLRWKDPVFRDKVLAAGRVAKPKLAKAVSALWKDPAYRKKQIAARSSSVVKEKASKTQKIIQNLPEVKARRSKAAKLQWKNEDFRVLKAGSHRRLWATEEFREKMLVALRRGAEKRKASGKKAAPEANAKIGAASKKRWEDPEYRARVVEAQRVARTLWWANHRGDAASQRGRKRTAETCAKMSTSQKCVQADRRRRQKQDDPT